jgi:hypothetical protein
MASGPDIALHIARLASVTSIVPTAPVGSIRTISVTRPSVDTVTAVSNDCLIHTKTLELTF